MKNKLLVLGVMTGNSLDAMDIAAFQVEMNDDEIINFKQVAFATKAYTPELKQLALSLRSSFASQAGMLRPELVSTLESFTIKYNQLFLVLFQDIQRSLSTQNFGRPDLIAVHGQTLGHCPRSIAGNTAKTYTIQAFNGALLADDIGIPVVADFRSDDVLAGGEGAPFAPMYQLFLSSVMSKEQPQYVNAGNTSNIAVISTNQKKVTGWDCGPCNHFPDLLMREEKQLPYDSDALFAVKGNIDSHCIQALWNEAVVTSEGKNGLLLSPPRSFDPLWYQLPELLKKDSSLNFNDRIRNCIAFSAYCAAHSVGLSIKQGASPDQIILVGGGWKNPLLRKDFVSLCTSTVDWVLPEHAPLFKEIQKHLKPENIIASDEVGIPSNGMEAGIFAYAALCKILGRYFSLPSVTGCGAPTMCGAVFTPKAEDVELFGNRLSDDRKNFTVLGLSRASLANQS